MRECEICCLLFINIIAISRGVGVIPSLAPLQYVTLPVLQQIGADYIEKTLLNAVLPVDQQDAIAIFISEGVSGALGGIAAKAVTLINGNKNNKDSLSINAGTSGLYFGVTGAIRALAQISGLSTIALNLFALVLGTAFTEALKFRSRQIVPQMTRVDGGPTMYELMKFKEPSMYDLMKFQREAIGQISNRPRARSPRRQPNPGTPTPERLPSFGDITKVELQADIVKWSIVYTWLPSPVVSGGGVGMSNFLGISLSSSTLETAVIIGAISGLVSQLVREPSDREIDKKIAAQRNDELRPWDKQKGKIKPEYTLTRSARAAVEGAVQLLTYQASREYVLSIGPYYQALTYGKLAPEDMLTPF